MWVSSVTKSGSNLKRVLASERKAEIYHFLGSRVNIGFGFVKFIFRLDIVNNYWIGLYEIT